MTPDVRICFAGDSFVHGWVGRVCAAARGGGVELAGYNLGVRRDTSADIARRWRSECAARLPAGVAAHVVFAFGTNDTTVEDGRCRVDPEAAVAHLRGMLATAAAAGAHPGRAGYERLARRVLAWEGWWFPST